jgi:2-polyprenyl-6-methoxyphenol hydroxylase-like FAD-dependent oxidoreductase
MKILISGAGIAGMTAANLLHAKGHEIVVIDKAHEFTNAGFVLSLKSFGVDILKELGLDAALRSKSILSNYVNFFQPDGKLIRQLSYEVINKKLPQSFFAARGDIHSVIYQSVKDKVHVLLNTTIENVIQSHNTVQVSLSDNTSIDADLLIISEGLRSSTREICFEESVVEDFNIFYLAGRLNRRHGYELGVFKSFMGIKKMFAIFPLTETELALQCYIFNTGDIKSLQVNAKNLLSTSFKDFNEEVQNLVSEVIENGLLFSDKIGMVHTSNLVDGRVILLGDAGYCPTALSGMGASLSIYGAKALSYFLEQNARDISKALQSYNDCLQPVIEKFQKNAGRNTASFLPQNAAKYFYRSFLLRIAPESVISNRMSRELGLTEKQKVFDYA